jgi:hypothetical protein
MQYDTGGTTAPYGASGGEVQHLLTPAVECAASRASPLWMAVCVCVRASPLQCVHYTTAGHPTRPRPRCVCAYACGPPPPTVYGRVRVRAGACAPVVCAHGGARALARRHGAHLHVAAAGHTWRQGTRGGRAMDAIHVAARGTHCGRAHVTKMRAARLPCACINSLGSGPPLTSSRQHVAPTPPLAEVFRSFHPLFVHALIPPFVRSLPVSARTAVPRSCVTGRGAATSPSQPWPRLPAAGHKEGEEGRMRGSW